MAMDKVAYEIFGDDMQLAEITLDPGEGVCATGGAMMYMDEGIEMQTSSGGLLKGLKRMVTGASFFLPTFECTAPDARRIAFAAPYPGKIVPLELAEHGGNFICQKESFLCAARGVEIEVAFTKRLGAGLFGGEGFVLQRLTGQGRAFLHAGGTIIQRELAAGESLKVDTGCVVGFAPSVNYDIKTIGGVKNALFGGEGLFLTHLTGPGLVYLQSLPFARLADRIIAVSGVDND